MRVLGPETGRLRRHPVAQEQKDRDDERGSARPGAVRGRCKSGRRFSARPGTGQRAAGDGEDRGRGRSAPRPRCRSRSAETAVVPVMPEVDSVPIAWISAETPLSPAISRAHPEQRGSARCRPGTACSAKRVSRCGGSAVRVTCAVPTAPTPRHPARDDLGPAKVQGRKDRVGGKQREEPAEPADGRAPQMHRVGQPVRLHRRVAPVVVKDEIISNQAFIRVVSGSASTSGRASGDGQDGIGPTRAARWLRAGSRGLIGGSGDAQHHGA